MKLSPTCSVKTSTYFFPIYVFDFRRQATRCFQVFFNFVATARATENFLVLLCPSPPYGSCCFSSKIPRTY